MSTRYKPKLTECLDCGCKFKTDDNKTPTYGTCDNCNDKDGKSIENLKSVGRKRKAPVSDDLYKKEACWYDKSWMAWYE
jgi:hypothetical protein